MKMTTIISIVLAVIGVGMLAGGGYKLVKRSQFLKTAVETQGVVVGHKSSSQHYSGGQQTSSGGTAPAAGVDISSSFPEVEFQAPDGKTVRFTSHIPSWEVGVETGARVSVLYDPANPENADAKIAATSKALVAFLILIGLGVLLILAAALVYFIFGKSLNVRTIIQTEENNNFGQVKIKRLESE